MLKVSVLSFFYLFCTYSLVAQIKGGAFILENFEGLNIQSVIPHGWSKKGDLQTFKLIKENDNVYLAGHYDCEKAKKSNATILFKELEMNYQKYPFFSWRWRVRQFPEGADEKVSEKSDSAVGIYLYIRTGVVTRKIIKFVWSNKYKAGEYFKSPNSVWAWETIIYVLRGVESTDLKGKWVNEKINLKSVFEKIFSKKLKNSIKGFGIITDADNTCSVASGDYDDFIMTEY